MDALQCFNYLIPNGRWVGKSFGAGIYWSLERVGHSRYNCGDRKSGTSWIVARVISCGIGSLIPSCYFYFLDFLTNFLHFSTFRTTPLYQLFSLLLIPQLSYFHTSFLLLHMGRKCCFLHCHSNYDTSQAKNPVLKERNDQNMKYTRREEFTFQHSSFRTTRRKGASGYVLFRI